MPLPPRRSALIALLTAAALVPLTALVPGGPATAAPAKPQRPEPGITRDLGKLSAEVEGAQFQLDRDAYATSRRIAGDRPLDVVEASQLRAQAVTTAEASQRALSPEAAKEAKRAWTQIGPTPTRQVARTSGTVESVTGRISSLALDSTGRIYLGAAQGGVWSRDAGSASWVPLTDSLPTLAVGSIAVAASDEDVLYLGTGEGDLSGDSYAGDGFWRSGDRGRTWTHVSGDAFAGLSVARLVVDPTDADHLYAATLRGRNGARRVTPPASRPYGLYESRDGGRIWTLRKGGTPDTVGATDVRLDPLAPSTVYASFLGDGIYKSTDSGRTWAKAMTGLPVQKLGPDGRAALGISHPSASAPARLYTGFEWFDAAGTHHDAQVFTSTDGAATWQGTSTGVPASIDSVVGYCGTQCSYDNVLEVDPTNPKVVYAGGLYNYSLAGGGVYRSTDGGASWKTLGYDLHPDFHALALQPGKPDHVVLGNDGGVWDSPDRGGRLGASDPLTTVDWANLNDGGLQTSQFTSIAAVPGTPGTFWGGTQDNGTQLKLSPTSPTWYDIGVGDGGQVLVDPDDERYVYGTHYSISPYRIDTSTLAFGGYEDITRGINLSDRSEFYVPWVMNKGNTSQLFTGTYRVYRTDNAKADKASDVTWAPISGDLTSGCTGPAPNGARGCLISALGVADGGTGVYAGTDDGRISVSTNAVTSATPSWTRVGVGVLPNRPVTQIAVDRSNWRIAYASFAGFGAATPGNRGHVFATRDGGSTWTDTSNGLPDVPVNSVLLDPAHPQRLYAGTDIGAFLTTDGGASWTRFGSGLPRVAVWQLDEDSRNGVLAAGTHGRGAWSAPTGVQSPALVLQTSDTGKPVGPGSRLTYRLTLRNVGNQSATGGTLQVPVPNGTSFVAAGSGGTASGGTVSWSGLAVPAQGSTTVTLTVEVSRSLPASMQALVLDGARANSREGGRTSGSPYVTRISPQHAVEVVPTAATDGARVGQAITYPLQVHNLGYQPDAFTVTATGGWATQVLDAGCSTALTTTPTTAPGATTQVCIRVTVPAGAPDGAKDTAAVKVTSVADPSVRATASTTSIAVAIATLLVDGDGNAPDVSGYYADALRANGTRFATWDLAATPDLPAGYLSAHTTVLWETGNSYPAPITRYEPQLTALLQAGGRLFMSGQDILDQSAGTTPFVRDFLHIAWDGSDDQNDKPTATVTGKGLFAGVGTVPIDHSVLGAAYEDRVTPISPATVAFVDDTAATDALAVSTGGYKVVFLAFPFEAYGTTAQKTALMGKVLGYFRS